ncbi:hypothetical protein FS842_005278 [Serendipita sp. 407]|nr:hypothetical protein FS842_005278 [Serendipita sp. 407]
MLMNKTKKFASVLANALDSIPFATDQEELRLKLLEQLLPHNLRMDLLLECCYPCGHYPIITNAFASPVDITYQELRGSELMEFDAMEVDSWSE